MAAARVVGSVRVRGAHPSGYPRWPVPATAVPAGSGCPLAGRAFRRNVPRGALSAGGELPLGRFALQIARRARDSTDIACRGVHRQVNLAPRTPARRTMLAGQPFAITAETNAGAVHCPAGHCTAMSREGSAGSGAGRSIDKGSEPRSASDGGTGSNSPAPASRDRSPRSGSRQNGRSDGAVGRRGPGLRPLRAETIPRIVSRPPFTLRRQAGLNGAVGEGLGVTAPAGPDRVPLHLRIEPDRKGATPLARGVVAGPARRAIVEGARLRHATDLTL